ncbi:MAG: CehA/McbA family metallohydrolase [Pirellulaceae bacterium]|nr:CehA/McbA family metallohydrolase [Pirellulaceae bacterium]
MSGNPETQIARLAMWDDNADKIVQTNHPNMRQMVLDRDLDGKEDGGFSRMLDYMDVIEVHPPEAIFRDSGSYKDDKDRDKNRMLPWMALIKSGRRIPGVVNTDAHYNWHGSGWLRNWIRSDTDDPAKITVANMIENLERGRVIMSTGPFMTVQLHHQDLPQPGQIGDVVNVAGDGELAVRVQCPNWLDVNRVEVFVDGELQADLSRTRAQNPDSFSDQVVKFDQRLPIDLKPGSFVIVAAIGEKLQLGRVMGEQYGKRVPVVVSNPIYIGGDRAGKPAE